VEPLPLPLGSGVYAVLLSAMILVVGIFWNPLAVDSDKGVSGFQRVPVRQAAEARVPGVQP
jgi:hypothetical protein